MKSQKFLLFFIFLLAMTKVSFAGEVELNTDSCQTPEDVMVDGELCYQYMTDNDNGMISLKVYFELNKWKLNEFCRKKVIERVKEITMNMKSSNTIDIIGSAGNSGTGFYNQELASKRIEELKKIINKSPVKMEVELKKTNEIVSLCINTGRDLTKNGEIKEDRYAQMIFHNSHPLSENSKVSAIVSKIRNMSANLKTSVWKDKDGNFNKHRLLSDSIAGVVLGTAGGLITSTVMKKVQVKNGYEDIQCTINGQSVASYGDEFSVGIK